MGRAPFLVTGMPRSGTTWVGKMLAAGGDATYISEPLNPLHPGIFRLRVGSAYPYIDEAHEAPFLRALRQAAELQPRFGAELAAVRRPVDVARATIRGGQFLHGRLAHRRALFKDPYAAFSAEWFADRVGCQVVICVRSPLAVVSSLKRLNWRAPLGDLARQPRLRQRWLGEFQSDLELALSDASYRRSTVWSNAVLWSMIHAAFADYRDRRPDFLFVQHEELSRDPQASYAELYARLGLPFSPQAQNAVARSTDAENPAELDLRRPHEVRLDSRTNLDNWRRRLSADEVAMIRHVTDPVATRWY